MQQADTRPLVLVTGAGGAMGSVLSKALAERYRVVGLDLKCGRATVPCLEVDLTSDDSLARALDRLRREHGDRVASVIHLAAYFDFTGETSPMYEKVNEEGTRRLLSHLQALSVEQFVYASTMLVHEAGVPGERIDEETPIAPKWAYPRSKAATEAVIAEAHGAIPVVVLRLAGLYDSRTAVPTLAHQIARIYERDPLSHLHAGDLRAGQSMVHMEDLIDAFARTVERRAELPDGTALLIGEVDAPSYQTLQSRIGALIHGEEEWPTLTLPSALAKAGAWAEAVAEPVIPDMFDKGEQPFIRPFMIDLAADHYALNIDRARRLLGWEPRHSLERELPALVQALKDDPLGWYRANGITPADWMESAAAAGDNPQTIRTADDRRRREAHFAHLWAPFANLGLASWLVTAPPLLGYPTPAMAWSDIGSGLALALFAALSLSPRLGWARWAAAAVGLWLMSAPLVFWAPAAAAYLNGTLVGMLVVGFAVLAPPVPGVGAVAAESGPTTPPGWSMNPSSWLQRLPIILLALVGLHISRYLAAYQLGHIDGVWEPFFAGGADPKNGTEEIITSSVSEAWPVPDAGLGALTYALEILTGIIGSTARWRTMPWLVVLFGVMIVPLGVVSITFIIIQPIVIGTWCTLCLVGAAAMLIQIPYSLDELVATGQFLLRRKREGRNLLRVFLRGDTDIEPGDAGEGLPRSGTDEFRRPAGAVVADMLSGGVGLPWTLGVSMAIGAWLMLTRLVLGAEGAMADADHVIGALVVTVAVTACAEVARAVRLVNIGFGIALLITPFAFGADTAGTISGLVCGLALIGLSLPRGRVRERFGSWNRLII